MFYRKLFNLWLKSDLCLPECLKTSPTSSKTQLFKYLQTEFFWYATKLSMLAWRIKMRFSWRNLHKVIACNIYQFHHMYWRKRLCNYLKAHWILDFFCSMFSFLGGVRFRVFLRCGSFCFHLLNLDNMYKQYNYVSIKTDQVPKS